MSKSSSSKLSDLINSLSKSEKRYFNIYASKHVIGKNNKYVKLFDLISLQKPYNEKELNDKLRLKNEKQLSDLKLYLYELILRSLREYNTNKSIEIEIYQKQIDVQVLFNKGLFNQCSTLIESIKSIAGELEKFDTMIAFNDINLQILRKQNDYLLIEKQVIEQQLWIKKLENHNQYELLLRKAMNIHSKFGVPRNDKELKKYTFLYSEVSQLNDPLSIRAQNILFNIFAFYYLLSCNVSKHYEFNKKRLNLMHKHPSIFDAEPYRKVNILNSYIDSSLTTRKYSNAIEGITQLQNLNMGNDSLSNYKQYFYYYSKLNYIITTCQFNELPVLLENIQKWINDNRSVYLRYQNVNLARLCSYAFFISGNLNKAIGYIKLLFDKDKLDEDEECLCRLMYIIYRFESKEYDWLHYLLRSLYRFLLKKEKLYELEKLILHFIRKAIDEYSQGELVEKFKFFKSKLLLLENNPFEKARLYKFDFIAWFDSKIEDKPLTIILSKQFNAHK